jgi:type I restriction enzyme, R subunit
MLLHYAANILPNGFKAMVVAVSRLASIRYRDALEVAQKKLLARLEQLPPEQRDLPEEQLKHLNEDEEIKKLIRAYPYRDTLARLQFAAVVSPNAKDLIDDRVDWRRWTDEEQQTRNIENFKKPLHHADPDQSNPLAFLCVRSMLITGSDAPLVQALYLDRSIKDHELLQAIARVNRVYADKTSGLVVDYFGIANNLKEALIAYSESEVQGALTSIKDELPLLADRHRRMLAIFQAHQVSIQDVESSVRLLKELKIRADFEIKFKKFMQSMDIVLPRPEALPYVEDAQQFGLINRAAAVTYRDEQLNLTSIGNKVRRLIDEHIEALKIRQLVEPISILDENFERKLRRHKSDENNAAEMEHLARAYIDYHFKQEDPAYYQKLSERLDEIVQTLYENWSQRVDALESFIKLMRQPRRVDFTGLDPRTERPFFGILEEEVRKGSRRFAIPFNPEGNGRSLSDAELLQLADLTRLIVQSIRREIANNDDFWLTAENHERLRREIGRMLEREGQRLLDPYTRREAVASRLVSLAHALTPRLRNE